MDIKIFLLCFLQLFVISNLTFTNKCDKFMKWCNTQKELGNFIDIFTFENIFYVVEK